MQKGNISVQTENIFPIIKKFLYADQEIFLRELIANAIDATSKLKLLANSGELNGEIGDINLEIILDEDAKTLTIRDKGIGMTEEEVLKYLNQIAFSSASEWLDKYKDDASIIGHFGLGFYSAFMVADKVEVNTLSWKPDSKPVQWVCTGSPEYEINDIEKETRGTDIVLHVGEEGKEFLNKNRIDELLMKYCRFLPVPSKLGTRTETEGKGEGDDKETIETEVDNIINNPSPAWKKNPSELNPEDYNAFYNELYPYSAEPLFHIHLNIDFPFNLTGILYFPQLNNSFEVQKNKIQLYSNQVWVTDDVKEIVPEWLTLLHGIIDSPDIPLNVSRSALQSDSNVRKITGYITKKVADKLHELFKKDRKEFESKWKSLGVFVKYGFMSDEKFAEKANKFLLLQNVDNEFFLLDDYIEKVKETQKNKFDKIIILYTNHKDAQDFQIAAAKEEGYDVVLMDNVIDNHFIQQLEYKRQEISFKRVDANTVDNLIEKDEEKESALSEKETEKVKGLFQNLTESKGNIIIEIKPLSPSAPPVQIVKPEFMRRMKEMQSMNGMNLGDMPDSYNLIVNGNHPLVAKKLLSAKSKKQGELAEYFYNLALLHQNMLQGKDLTAFINKSLDMVK